MFLLYPLAALAAALGAGAVLGEVNKGSDPVRLRTLNRSDAASPMKWEAVELLSDSALYEVGLLMDLALAPYATQCRTGLYTVFLLTDQTDGTGRAIAVLARKSGESWVIDQTFGRSGAQAPADLVKLAQAIAAKMGGASASAPAYAIPDEVVESVTVIPDAGFQRALPAPIDGAPIVFSPQDEADHVEVRAGGDDDEVSDPEEYEQSLDDDTLPEDDLDLGGQSFDNPDEEEEGASI
jgi:hypothetical protein